MLLRRRHGSVAGPGGSCRNPRVAAIGTAAARAPGILLAAVYIVAAAASDGAILCGASARRRRRVGRGGGTDARVMLPLLHETPAALSGEVLHLGVARRPRSPAAAPIVACAGRRARGVTPQPSSRAREESLLLCELLSGGLWVDDGCGDRHCGLPQTPGCSPSLSPLACPRAVAARGVGDTQHWRSMYVVEGGSRLTHRRRAAEQRGEAGTHTVLLSAD